MGIVVALAAPALGLIGFTISYALSYNGKCGGFLPWLAAAQPCTLGEYVAGNLSLLTLIVFREYWLAIVLLLALPVGIGYALDARTKDFTG